MFQKLFTPQKIGKLTIPNRLVVPAMVTNFCDSDGNATERYIAYHEAKARGGFGLVITEDYAISPEGRGFPYVAGLWNDSQIASHAKLPERVHAAGGLVFAQIYHCGRQTNEASNGGLPVIAPSPIRDPRKHSDPKEMTTEDIRRVVRQFGETAARAKMAGFDGIELHGGHGYLLSQFMSSYSNKRVDEYGGGFLGRMRIVREVIEEVRSQVGGDYPIIFRISTKEYMPGGRDREDTRAAAVYLERWGVDALHVSVGTYGDNTNIVPMYVSHGWIVDYAEEMKKNVSIPIITVNRLNDPFLADAAIAAGKADFVAMGRGSLADPELPNKAKSGRLEEIRSCIGCMQGCVDKLHELSSITCLVNPMLGRESEFASLPKSAHPKRVLVIGGGPAGIEAARGAALAGHAVELHDANAHLGGQFTVAAYPPGKGEFTTYVAWAANELRRLGVNVVLNNRLDPTDIADMRFDHVILALGSVPAPPPIPGIDGENVVAAGDILLNRRSARGEVVIAGGGLVGVETAIYLAIEGKRATILEMLPSAAQDAGALVREHLYRLLDHYRIDVRTGHTIVNITPEGVTARDAGGTESFYPAETVVLALGARSDPRVSQFAEALKSSGIAYTVVGDARGIASNALDATREGFEAGVRV